MQTHVFHPAVEAWFDRTFEAPTPPQAEAWPSIQSGRHTLIAAPTGSGKTLAAFLSAIDDLVRRGERGELEDETHVLYISPLKALSNDIHKNLEEPLSGIGAELAIRGFPDFHLRTLVRTGDTSAKDRNAMVRRPPHIVVTTPESFAILLTSERGRRMLKTVRTVIVDEIHAVVESKRGSHLALALERLEALTPEPLVRVGLSATQRPIDAVARFLVGAGNLKPDGSPRCTIIDSGHVRTLDLAVEVPGSPLETVMSNEVWEEIYDRITALIREHRTTLVFVNTRKLSERVARHLSERLGEENVTAHHGSLSKEQRLSAEQRLKDGKLMALVATASLELGIDIGDVDLVCQMGSTRSIAAFLQRVGRSGHAVGAIPKGRLFPTSRDELVECAAILDAVRREELDVLQIPEAPLDILAQHIVAAVACEEWEEDALYRRLTSAAPYRKLPRESYDAVVRMLAQGFSTRRGRRGAYVHRDAVNRRLRARRGARLAAITSGGAIPDNADFRVIQQPAETFVGTVNEDFATESMAGDIFQLGNTSWRILKIETGKVRVEDAAGLPPTIPFWLGEAPSRSAELSAAVSRLRKEIASRLDGAGENEAARRWLTEEIGLSEAAAVQMVNYLAAGKTALGVMPTQDTLVLERFFDETGGMQLVIHSPYGSRLNRAWGLALRKRFCRKFNFELQAAATEDAIVLSLGPTHSFPLDEVFYYLNPRTVRDLLVQALLDAPMFAVRWRWNAGRSLAVLRFAGGRKVPPQFQRMQAEDLVSVVFPDQLACVENLSGDREIPDHPLVQETIRDCLYEAMDIERLEKLLRSIHEGDLKLVARDVREPSPFAAEILNAKPYAFLDDAPLEERRTQAVMNRRWLDPETASDLGALDAAAVSRVRDEAWPDAVSADELHDALMVLGFLTAEEGLAGPRTEGEDTALPEWPSLLEELIRDGRATRLRPGPGRLELWVTAERLPEFRSVFPEAILDPEIDAPDPAPVARETALVELVRSRLEGLGPVTAARLAEAMGLDAGTIETPLLTLESEGFVLRGQFTPGSNETEWCERRLLARIHRYTLNRLRREIEPVSASDFMRFLFKWQGLIPGEQSEGPDALKHVVEQLEGFEGAATAWERDILPARVAKYDPAWLDALCLSGRIAWARLAVPHNGGSKSGPVRSTPIALIWRSTLCAWLQSEARFQEEESGLSSKATAVLNYLQERGASFFHEIVQGTGLLQTQTEEALGELVSAGRITADSFTGLRALLLPTDRRRRPLGRGNPRRRAPFGIEDAGRWSVLPRPVAVEDSGKEKVAPPGGSEDTPTSRALVLEHLARALLRRYGVMFRRLLDQEGPLPPWRDLLRVYYRLEARGEIRGGRFVSGFSGQQFALPEAVGTLREVRRKDADGALISVAGPDPLNLTGIVTPGARVPSVAGNRILYRDGVPLAVHVAGESRLLETLDGQDAWRAKKALERDAAPPNLRAYLGR